MGRPPAVVIVARHGARLDAADRQWHLTSPTPYDPPLTYGGWTQCRALGARIASLLETREKLSERLESDGIPQLPLDHAPDTKTSRNEARKPAKPVKGRKKKHKIVIHTSPFLRCIQTSVAISAGISQYRGQHDLEVVEKPVKKSAASLEPPPKANPSFSASPNLTAIADEEIPPTSSPSASTLVPHPHIKPKLRVDAFLGEWLSPDYYENITPPPGSVMMVAGAKADLLRRGEYIDVGEDAPQDPVAQGNFPGGWGSMSGPGTPELGPQDKLMDDIAKITLRSPKRERASTLSSNGSFKINEDAHALRLSPTSSGYTPPVPRYAISPSDPIPAGYVQHARDACVEVDYQWDSMRPPQNWGDGGDYGEEWSHMHKRFRRGLNGMVNWYRAHHETANQLRGHKRVLHPHPKEEDDEDTDTVVILVTHGAGCNALIGGLTGQPVLMDVSMASLTMAIRKEEPQLTSNASPPSPTSPRPSSDTPLSAIYTVRLTASIDHLRAASFAQPLSIPLLNGGRPAHPHHHASLSQPTNSNTAPFSPGPRVVPRRLRVDSLPPLAPSLAPTSSPFSPMDNKPTNRSNLHRSASAVGQRPTGFATAPASGAPSRSNSGLWGSSGRGSDASSGANSRRTWTVGQSDGVSEKDRFRAENKVDGAAAMWGGSAISSGAGTPAGQRTPERKSSGLWGGIGLAGSGSVGSGGGSNGMVFGGASMLTGSAIDSGVQTPENQPSTPTSAGKPGGGMLWGGSGELVKSPTTPSRSGPTFPGVAPPLSARLAAESNSSLPRTSSPATGASGPAAGVWGGGMIGGASNGASKAGLPKPGVSAMAAALGAGEDLVHRGSEEDGELREREWGHKRRWTVNERSQ